MRQDNDCAHAVRVSAFDEPLVVDAVSHGRFFEQRFEPPSGSGNFANSCHQFRNGFPVFSVC